jgi:osmotically-inducible protein OsmY
MFPLESAMLTRHRANTATEQTTGVSWPASQAGITIKDSQKLMELRDDVAAELRWDPAVRNAVIGLSVTDGVVTLTGRAPCEAERRAAGSAASRVRGVKIVVNHIQVQPCFCDIPDADLARVAEHWLCCMACIPPESVHVAACDGWITLNGQVAYQYQRDEAELAVCQMRGVMGVTNQIVIASPEKPADIGRQIKAALQRCAAFDAQWITVESYKGSVILRGSVRSWLEREQAEAIAWRAPGVVDVTNRLTILA